MLARAMTAQESAIPLSALVTHLDVTVIVCRRMGARRSEGSTAASDPNRRWATIVCGRPARHERRIGDA
jgi:hypothetical protein